MTPAKPAKPMIGAAAAIDTTLPPDTARRPTAWIFVISETVESPNRDRSTRTHVAEAAHHARADPTSIEPNPAM
jgi:hypothetical protein